jgi:hypothetical protein
LKKCHKCGSKKFFHAQKSGKFGIVKHFDKCEKCGAKQNSESAINNVINHLMKGV